MKKGVILFLTFILIGFLCVSLVSANWFSDIWGKITGQVTSDLSLLPTAIYSYGSDVTVMNQNWTRNSGSGGVDQSSSVLYYYTNPNNNIIVYYHRSGFWYSYNKHSGTEYFRGSTNMSDPINSWHNEGGNGASVQSIVPTFSLTPENYQIRVCTDFVYTTWSVCNSTGIQTRAIITSLPNNCTGGSPILIQMCNYTAPICIDNDGGQEYYSKGTTGLFNGTSWINNTDYCYNTTSLLSENYCLNGVAVAGLYTCPNGCADGACLNLTIGDATCGDSDGGLNYYVYGSTKFKLGSLEVNNEDECALVSSYNASGYPVGWMSDGYSFSCSGENCYISEAYCSVDSNGILLDSDATKLFKCPNGCANGACINSTQITCNDTDGGLNYYVKGSAGKPSTASFDDVCLSVEELSEAFCNSSTNLASYVNIACPNECSDGACISENKICTPKYICETSPLVCPASGNQTKTCTDVECNNGSYSENLICNPGECGGCQVDGKCIPYGFREKIELFNNLPGTYNVYCDIDGRLKEQKTTENGEWAKCQNNYECYSNICSEGECIQAVGLFKEMKAFFVRMICKLSNPLSSESYTQCVADYST